MASANRVAIGNAFSGKNNKVFDDKVNKKKIKDKKKINKEEYRKKREEDKKYLEEVFN